MTDIKDGRRHVACYKCRYYQVTYDIRQPYGCRAHGFKTPRNPAQIVLESSGIECQLFELRRKNSEETG
jgi:hypothetical protein